MIVYKRTYEPVRTDDKYAWYLFVKLGKIEKGKSLHEVFPKYFDPSMPDNGGNDKNQGLVDIGFEEFMLAHTDPKFIEHELKDAIVKRFKPFGLEMLTAALLIHQSFLTFSQSVCREPQSEGADLKQYIENVKWVISNFPSMPKLPESDPQDFPWQQPLGPKLHILQLGELMKMRKQQHAGSWFWWMETPVFSFPETESIPISSLQYIYPKELFMQKQPFTELPEFICLMPEENFKDIRKFPGKFIAYLVNKQQTVYVLRHVYPEIVLRAFISHATFAIYKRS